MHLPAREPVIDVADRIPIGPALAKSVALHGPLQKAKVVVALHGDTVRAWIEGIGPAIFYVPGVVTALLQAQEIMHGLPRNASHRHLAGEMENDDVAALSHDWVRNRYRTVREQRSARQVISFAATENAAPCDRCGFR